jgi:RNA polymerase sigma factor (sigma-70 family)
LSHEPGPLLNDRASREAFVQEWYIEVYRWFCRLTGSPDRSADLTQETFAAFWQANDRKPNGVCPRTWLYAIGRNLWRKHARDRKSFEPVLLTVLADTEPPVEDRFGDREFQQAAEQALSELTDELREAFTLRFWQEFDYEQIGAIQGVTADLARWRYFAARRRLHEKLATWDPNPRRAKGDRHAR